MTSPSSGRVGAVQGSQHAATGPEPSSGVGPAPRLDEPTPYPRPLRSYLELGALPTAAAREVVRPPSTPHAPRSAPPSSAALPSSSSSAPSPPARQARLHVPGHR